MDFIDGLNHSQEQRKAENFCQSCLRYVLSWLNGHASLLQLSNCLYVPKLDLIRFPANFAAPQRTLNTVKSGVNQGFTSEKKIVVALVLSTGAPVLMRTRQLILEPEDHWSSMLAMKDHLLSV